MKTEQKQDHTPLPWREYANDYGDWGICDAKGRVLFDFEKHGVEFNEKQANSNLIVLAVNNHQRLVDAVKSITSAFMTMAVAHGIEPTDLDVYNSARLLLKEMGEE